VLVTATQGDLAADDTSVGIGPNNGVNGTCIEGENSRLPAMTATLSLSRVVCMKKS